VLVEPDADALAEGILSILRDPSKGHTLGEAARQYAFEHLGWNRFVRSVGEIYEDAHRCVLA
jgi:glycosyltransferase involved in cell wall biosynthesis